MEAKWLQISLMHYPVTVLGPGKRAGVWVQGCSLRCPGCISVHSWDFNGGERIYFDELFGKLKEFNTNKITISGGEPFEQKYFLEFLQTLKEFGFNDVFVYSGFEWDYIEQNFKKHLQYIDALVCGRFIQGDESPYLYKGSNNQEMIILSRLFYKEYDAYRKLKKNKRLQRVKNFIIGIPYQKDLKQLKELKVV